MILNHEAIISEFGKMYGKLEKYIQYIKGHKLISEIKKKPVASIAQIIKK